MKLISLGDVNKNLIYILVGGISKLVAELILYFFANDVKMKRHPFILGINAGIGMMFAFIPDLIVKYKMKVKLIKINYNFFLLYIRLYSENIDFFI